MKKRILTLALALLLLLPVLPVRAQAAELPMPRTENIAPLYDRDDFVLCVLNEYGEVWLYYTSHTLNADNSLTYTHDAAGDICVTTGAKAISAVDYGLLVLDQDGTLRFWRIRDHKATLQETVLTGIEDIGENGVYRLLALDKQGGLHYINTKFSDTHIDITVTKIDSGVSLIAEHGKYIKGNKLMSYTNGEYKEVISGLPDGIVDYWDFASVAYALTQKVICEAGVSTPPVSLPAVNTIPSVPIPMSAALSPESTPSF